MSAAFGSGAADRLTVAIVGCGNMGAAILASASERLPGYDFVAVDPDLEKAGKLLPDGVRVRLAREFDERIHADCVILAVKPQALPEVLAGIHDRLAGKLVVSIAAGVGERALAGMLPPGTRLVRAMPNLAAMVGAAMTVGFARELSASDRVVCAEVFSSVGRFAWVDTEEQVDAATAVSGSGPGYVFAFLEHLATAGEALGLSPDLAAILARQTLVGAGRVLASDDRSAHELKVAVTSPGGTTQAGLAILEAPEAFPDCLSRATKAAFDRALELSEPKDF
jgi:pyrroline-5-carboxylate reductase